MFSLFLFIVHIKQQLPNEPERSRLSQSKSKSKERISDEKMSFFEKSAKDTTQQQKSGYTREYSYNIDSETLRHSGQSDPRGLGFTYEKTTTPANASNKQNVSSQKGTALAFTYNPQGTSRSDVAPESVRTQQKEVHSRKSEPKYIERKSTQLQKGSQILDEKGYQTRPKSPETRGEAMRSNLDESSELSSTSRESMVDEYAKESMRQKTSALIAGSTANNSPALTKSIYGTQTRSYSPQHSITKTTSRPLDSDQSIRYGVSSQEPAKQQRQSLWGQETRPFPSASTRLPVLTPAESAGIERKYTHLSRKRVVQNADGSVEEREEIIDPDSFDYRKKSTQTKPLSLVMIDITFLVILKYNFVKYNAFYTIAQIDILTYFFFTSSTNVVILSHLGHKCRSHQRLPHKQYLRRQHLIKQIMRISVNLTKV